jgi:hypothetical protein
MRRITSLGVCLAAVLAASALAASSASALPEFTGPFAKTFIATSGKTVLETVSKTKVTCASDVLPGEITGPQTGLAALGFAGCKMKKVPCNTPNSSSGFIGSTLLAMKVGYINKSKKQVGIDFSTATGAAFAEFTCGTAVRAVVRGSVIGAITPVNTAVVAPKTFTLKFVQKKGLQAVPNLEGEPVDVLESTFGGPFELTGLKATEAIPFPGTVELKA